MMNVRETSKLAELHSKTDRQLAEMVDRMLESGLILAAAAGGDGDRTLADRFLSRAENCRDQAERLLYLMHDPAHALRAPLERKLAELRKALERRLTVCC